MPTPIPPWIDGARREGTSGRTAPVTDPATGQVTGEVALADVGEVDAAVAAAVAASPGRRDTSPAGRTAVLFRFRQLLDVRKPELAAIDTAEHGKVLDDALREVSRGQEVVKYTRGVSSLVRGGFTATARRSPPTTTAPPAGSSTGWGSGMIGTDGFDTRGKAITSRWPDPSQRPARPRLPEGRVRPPRARPSRARGGTLRGGRRPNPPGRRG